MKRYIKHIYLIWRRGRNDSRIKIGKITRNQTEGVRFEYISDGVKEALEKGFNMYPDFPNPATGGWYDRVPSMLLPDKQLHIVRNKYIHCHSSSYRKPEQS